MEQRKLGEIVRWAMRVFVGESWPAKSLETLQTRAEGKLRNPIRVAPPCGRLHRFVPGVHFINPQAIGGVSVRGRRERKFGTESCLRWLIVMPTRSPCVIHLCPRSDYDTRVATSFDVRVNYFSRSTSVPCGQPSTTDRIVPSFCRLIDVMMVLVAFSLCARILGLGSRTHFPPTLFLKQTSVRRKRFHSSRPISDGEVKRHRPQLVS